MLSASRIVMEVSRKTRVFPPSTVPFDCGDDDEGCPDVVFVGLGRWTDMGSPEKITITIEPGDKLNEEGDDDQEG